ncbi:TPA: acyltransferase family protein [Streptococcus pneumoniae]|uniref:acyltransferase family protein n=1 Tax=Streptococcus pneumoniae TaxID=1313 RepID=UPI00376E6D78
MTKVRINWVDFGKGFAIFLVLVGHVFIGLSESNKFSIANDVLLFLIAQIYIFYIPVFFALSGYFFRPVSDLKEFWYYAKKKTIILGIPYIFYSIIHFCLQKLAGASVRVPTTIHNLLNIYRYPLGVSWYLYTLWSILIVYGLLSIVFKNRKSLFLVSVFAYIFTLFIQIDIFIVQRTLVWGICFFLGSVLSEIHFDKINLKKFLFFFVLFDFIYMFAWFLFYEVGSKKDYVSYINPGLWGIAFIVCVLVAFAIFPKMEKNFPKTFLYFTKYGKDSLGIYILHAPICSMIRILMLKVGINSVFLHVVVGIVLGWYLSILATYILKKIPFLNIVLLPQKYIKLK